MKNTPTLRETCRVLFRHKQKVVAFFCVTMALVVLGIVFYPRTYQSEAKLFIRIGRQSVALDPTATTGQTIAVNESRESEINSVLELLKSRSITEKEVDTIGTSVILGKPLKPGASQSMQEDAKFRFCELDPISDRERAIHKIEEDVDISVPKKTNVITVNCEAKSPELAQEIVATLLDVYQRAHVLLHRTTGSYEFFSGRWN